MKPPCASCERKGCGTYHDQCEEYQLWVEKTRLSKRIRKSKNRESRLFPEYEHYGNSSTSYKPNLRRH